MVRAGARAIGLAGLLCVTALLGCASRQGPDGGAAPIAPFRVTSTDTSLFLRGEIRDEEEEVGSTGQTSTEEETFFEEGIDYATSGYIYHPNLIDWDADFRFSLAQQDLEIDDRDFDTEGTLLGFSLAAAILQEKPVSGRVFASDTEDVLAREFARRVELESARHGFEILTRGPFSASFLYEQIEFDEVTELRTTTEETDHFRFTIADQRDADWVTRFTYDHEDTEETSVFFPPGGGTPVVQDLPVDRDEFIVSNRWLWGGVGDRPNSLSGQLRLLRRGGFFENDITTFDQRLDLVHTDTFATFYRLLYDKNETDIETDELLNGEVGFTKNIYENLDLTGRLLASDQQFENGSEKVYGGFLEADYRKSTALGPYASHLLLGREWEEDEAQDRIRNIVDEPLVLGGLTFVQLSQPNVVPGSVVITTADQTVTFVEGVDYVLRQTGAFTEVRRLAGGDIADGETVLATYRALVPQDLEFTTDRVTWTNRLDLAGLPFSLYFDYRLEDEQKQSGFDPGLLETEETTLVGAEYAQGGLRVNLEHEERDRELFPPSSTNRARFTYQRRLGRQTDLSLGGGYEKLEYDDAQEFGLEPGRDSLDTVNAFGRLTRRLGRHLLVHLEADYFETTGRENDELLRTTVGLEGTYQKLDFSVEARHDEFQQEFNEGTEDSLYFNVRRRF
ncbi:MAG: hypothetical protein ACOC7T_01875 [Planctomycetota bacterium]